MDNKVKELRDSIFSLNTRKFGTVNEMLVERIVEEFGLIVEEPKDTSYDRKIDNSKDEIKGSRVLKESKLKFSKENIIGCILNHESHRMIKLDDASKNTWDSNIQQIKTDLFSTLWYSLYFEDKVVLFKIKNDLIKDKSKGKIKKNTFRIGLIFSEIIIQMLSLVRYEIILKVHDTVL